MESNHVRDMRRYMAHMLADLPKAVLTKDVLCSPRRVRPAKTSAELAPSRTEA